MRVYEITWHGTTPAGEGLSGTLAIRCAAGDSRLANAAWGRSAYAARLAGADMRRLLRVSWR